MPSPQPDDLVVTVDACAAALEGLITEDWSVPAANVDWTCRGTLEHLCVLAYGPQLAVRAQSFRPLALTVEAGAPLHDLLWTMRVMSLILAEVARAAPADARAFHPAGMADASGFVAMGMDELLVHTHDIATGLGAAFDPDEGVVRAVLDRLFPWWRRSVEPWPALLWANGRGSLPGHPALGAEWVWHCAPLDEWDGTIPRWDPVEQRPVEPTASDRPQG